MFCSFGTFSGFGVMFQEKSANPGHLETFWAIFRESIWSLWWKEARTERKDAKDVQHPSPELE
jgi:hypothetical protein